MKLYLSSFKIGDDPNKLKQLLPNNTKAVYISSGLDFAKKEIKEKHQDWDLKDLADIGVNAEKIDLRDFFGKQNLLRDKLSDINVLYVSGGNVYDLRFAMKESGLDTWLLERTPTDLLYAGYSAGVCVLSPTLKGYHVASNPDAQTYGDHKTVWEGLDIINWQFAPHYKSDHSESEEIDEEIEYFKKNNLPFKPLKDGEVLIQDALTSILTSPNSG